MMFKILYPFVLPIVLFSCSEPNKDVATINSNTNVFDSIENVEQQIPPIVNSKIREGESLTIGKVYVDTLTLLSLNDDYDYFFATVLTRNNDSVSMVYSELLDEKYKGRKMVVMWKMDSLYEAGENDALYFQERLVGFDVIRTLEDGFSVFLGSFLNDYTSQEPLPSKYLHPETGLYVSHNPGVYCAVNKVDLPETPLYSPKGNYQSNVPPKGDFCEGYTGAKDGYYFLRILPENLPVFDNITSGDYVEEKINLPEKYALNELMRVTVIINEYHSAFLYFIQIEEQWYLFVQDFCDCSA